jgi:hypothetical protein
MCVCWFYKWEKSTPIQIWRWRKPNLWLMSWSPSSSSNAVIEKYTVCVVALFWMQWLHFIYVFLKNALELIECCYQNLFIFLSVSINVFCTFTLYQTLTLRSRKGTSWPNRGLFEHHCLLFWLFMLLHNVNLATLKLHMFSFSLFIHHWTCHS